MDAHRQDVLSPCARPVKAHLSVDDNAVGTAPQQPDRRAIAVTHQPLRPKGATHDHNGHTHPRADAPRSFADGQTSPDRYPDDLEVRSFAEGEADPAGYPDDDRVGTFARGSSQPAAYPTDLYEGTFAEEDGRFID